MQKPLKTTHALSNTSQIDEDNLFTFDLQVPIKNGTHMIKVVGIPKDIKESDLQKVSAVILAYCN